MISVRIVLTDHYITPVNSQFDPVYSKLRHPIKQVPIIRIFGPNEEGKKVCLHLHGIFPYLLVKSPTDEIRYGEQLAQSLDMAINLSFEKGNTDTKHVHDINLVELLPIYGYHEKMVKFWKIEFYNPSIIRKAADLLLAGAVMNQEFQPHEAHVPFNLQFFIDYNLYGMNFILFNNACERNSSQITTNLSTASNQTTTISSVPRVSSCELEYDVHIDDICNKPPQIGKGIANPGLQALWNVGRILLDLWRILRSEITLNIYTFENAIYHVLHERVPHYDISLLSKWFIDEGLNPSFGLRDFVTLLDYGWTHSMGNFRLLYELDLINKTSEFARIYGIEFYHVLSRGSQYRVESMMIRLAKCLHFITVTPDNRQRLYMRAPECIPLTLEPISNIYFTPVAVLDFQSLYPSIIMAYNICYSTCLGRIDQLDKQGLFKFGCTSLTISDKVLSNLNLDTDIFCSPNGIAFVKRHIRRGILPVMLEEILATRVMVKNTMKLIDKKSTLYKTLDARQLCLKLIANVTFGYTSASFSGRMPCVEVGDTIVHTARTVLERAIDFIRTNPHFGGRVVYGDTDSLFIQFPHSTRAQAFEQSHLLVKALNQLYPSPIKIKFEKIYMQSVLASKKRYVGMSYEIVDQKQGKFDAKGIETVRRDTCLIVSKILQQSLKLLFQTKDVTRVRRYVQFECEKILTNRFNLLDFIFAKEYRGKTRYHPSAPVPALRIAIERAKTNPLAEPNQGERVPYVIGFNTELLNANLIDCVWTLDKVLQYKSQFKLNSIYYIKKQILPALDRCLALIGVNVFKWIDNLLIDVNSNDKQQGSVLDENIHRNTLRQRCIVCLQLTTTPLCNECREEEDLSEIMIICETKANKLERQHANLQRLCLACSDRMDGWFQCSTIDCPIRFRLHKITQLMLNAQETRKFVYNEC
ncbi:unnamed protein product [Rotaria sp. Silwood1]|nr:unnamed protein product [Rotaria sp. Silwood1]